MYDKSLTIEQILSMLAATPSRLAALTEGLPPAKLLASPEPPEWSARDVLAHLRACSDMWGKYILEILSEDMPTIKAVNPTTWIKKTDYREQGFLPSLQAFTSQRADLLAVLKPLAPEAWSRTATVTGAGKPRERTVYTYAQWLANHERSHLKQVERISNTMRGPHS
ncbi:MAG TPA: DinB family protein [Anaerolineales bacterium]|nr:DinB family protein [Anaerolineales bacterium]